MTRNSDSDIDRRTVVKALGAGAGLAVGFGAAGTAAATKSDGLDGIDTQDCTCSNEFRCDTSRFCSQRPPVDSPYQTQSRECCTCDGETVCEDWSDVDGGCCAG